MLNKSALMRNPPHYSWPFPWNTIQTALRKHGPVIAVTVEEEVQLMTAGRSIARESPA